MYIHISVVYCRPYPYTDTRYLFSNKSLDREIANIHDYEFCKEIYGIARDIATCEYLCTSFDAQFDDYSKIFD